jgi:hypothetical protein
MGQALRAGRIATKDEKKIKTLLDDVGSMLKYIPMDNTPPETGDLIYKKVREITGVFDPYKQIKKESIHDALKMYPGLKQIVKHSDNRLLTAIRIAIAGNIIDFGIHKSFDLEKDVQFILQQDFAILHFQQFVEQLKRSQSILYLGDNAGESVFDKILIEELGKPVTYVVREIPVINDMTYTDAINSGLDQVANIISSGCSAPGTILSLCNNEFKNQFEEADMIISKGQGNYEGLSTVDRSVFFLLKAKCKVIAKDLHVKEDDIVLKASDYH